MWAEDVETKRWFPRESTRRRISTLPGPAGSPFHLRNHYTILTPRQSTTAPVNQTISANCGLTVRGHVIVLRHAATNGMRITNIQHAERQFIDLVVQWYVHQSRIYVLFSRVRSCFTPHPDADDSTETDST